MSVVVGMVAEKMSTVHKNSDGELAKEIGKHERQVEEKSKNRLSNHKIDT